MTITEAKPQWGVNYGEGFDAFTVRKKDFVAAGIRWFSRWDEMPGLPPVSHAFKIIGKDLTIEAFSDGVHYGTLTAYLSDPDVALLVRKPILWTPEMGRGMVEQAQKHLGDKYGYTLIVAMALTRSFLGRGLDWLTRGWTTRFVDDLLDSKRQEICSELVAMADQAQPELAGKGVLAQPANTITPVMLFGDAAIYEPGAVELVP